MSNIDEDIELEDLEEVLEEVLEDQPQSPVQTHDDDDECWIMGPKDALIILIFSIFMPSYDVFTDMLLAYTLFHPRCYGFPGKRNLLMAYIFLKNQYITSKFIIFQLGQDLSFLCKICFHFIDGAAVVLSQLTVSDPKISLRLLTGIVPTAIYEIKKHST